MRIKSFVLVIMLISCSSNIKKHDNKDLVPNEAIPSNRIVELKNAFEQKDYAAFFHVFPDTDTEFVDLYGYDDITGAKPLYDDSYDHVSFLFNAPNDYLAPLAKKAIKIAIKLKWQADAENYFQEHLSTLIIDHTEIVLDELSTKSEKESTSFWYFVFDGSTKYDLQNKDKLKLIIEKVKPLDQKQSEILIKEFENMYK